MKVLLIDDCVDVGHLVHISLKPFHVDQVFNLAEARRALLSNDYHVLIIDVVLPDGNGFKFCEELSSHPKVRSVPKILLTSKASTSDKVFGFNCGADDYVTKPFDPPELKARVDLKLRRQEMSANVFKRRCFEFNPQFQRCLLINNDEKLDLQLTPTEFRLFWNLVKCEGSPLSREELVNLVWKAQGLNIETRGIDAHIRHLRRKLGRLSPMIVSVYGRGYAFKFDEACVLNQERNKLNLAG